MPELPEVEVVRRGLERVLPGETIRKVEVRWPKSFRGADTAPEGHEIQSVGRRGKMLNIQTKSGGHLLVHLRMTGQVLFLDAEGNREGGGHPTDSLISKLPNKHTHVIIHFASGSE